MISAPTVSLHAEGVYRAEGISCRKAYRDSRRDLYRASVGEDRIFPFRCCGGRMISAPTVSLHAEGVYRAEGISCRKAYRSEAISCPTGANWASDAARYVCGTQTRYTAAARQYDMLPFASTICGLCRVTIPPFIPPLHKGGMGEHASKSLPLRGEEMATRGKRATAPLKRSVSGVVPDREAHRMRWTRRKAERFSRMNCDCGAWRKR